MQKIVTRRGAVPPRIVPPRTRSVEVRPAGVLPEPGAPRADRTIRRVAVGVLMSAVVAGGTAGATFAATRDVPSTEPAVVRPADLAPAATPTPSTVEASAGTRVQDVVFSGGTTVFTWPTPSTTASATKSTPARLVDPGQGVVHRAGTATRVAVVWAVAATVVMGGILAGSVLRRT